ncbi:YdcF family protein [Hydrogenovibrio kuenenii]|uniref:YdcF family protein n=1 Tax=Hydrogenovibrio kuenenii TaxID=63658 RepID=UPI0004642D34|nr:YdcF family protein [Hydrogenovibrio kuenenii]
MDQVFFVLSKLAWALLSPSNLILFAFILGTLMLVAGFNAFAKRLLIITSIIAFIIMGYPVGDYLIRPLEKRFPILTPNELPQKVDGIIVLGGGEDLPRTLSWHQPQIGNGGDRYFGTKKLADHYPNVPIIFTGGSGQIKLQHMGGTEGSLAKQLLTTMGIAPERLIIESNSRNTYENFKYIYSLLPNRNGNYLLVTSAFHMARAVGVAQKFGIHVTPYPVDFRSNSAKIRTWDFDFFDHLKTLEPAWKEWIGLTVYYFTGRTSAWLPKATPPNPA